MIAAESIDASSPKPRLLNWLRAPVPLDVRTLFFAYAAGSVLSVPVAFLYAIIGLEFDPPYWTAPLYVASILVSMILLPIWTLTAGDRPILQRLGTIIVLLMLAGLVIAMLFPMIA